MPGSAEKVNLDLPHTLQGGVWQADFRGPGRKRRKPARDSESGSTFADLTQKSGG